MTVGAPAIRTEGLTKFYGSHRGIENVDLEVRRGEIFGFLGPNGAGKTTTIRLLLDLIRPSGGRAEVFGLDVNSRSLEVRATTGYLPGELALYEHMTGVEYLAYLGSLRGTGIGAASMVAERLGLDLTRRIDDLSKGNKQKVGIAQAFLHDPDLLILDEPTGGLDPLVQNEFHQMLRDHAARGKTIFLSSHVLSETEDVADRVAIIREGRLAVTEEIARLKEKAVRRASIQFATTPPANAFEGLAGVREVAFDGALGRFVIDGSMDALVKAAARFEVLDFVSEAADLEEIFLAYYGANDGG